MTAIYWDPKTNNVRNSFANKGRLTFNAKSRLDFWMSPGPMLLFSSLENDSIDFNGMPLNWFKLNLQTDAKGHYTLPDKPAQVYKVSDGQRSLIFTAIKNIPGFKDEWLLVVYPDVGSLIIEDFLGVPSDTLMINSDKWTKVPTSEPIIEEHIPV